MCEEKQLPRQPVEGQKDEYPREKTATLKKAKAPAGANRSNAIASPAAQQESWNACKTESNGSKCIRFFEIERVNAAEITRAKKSG